MHQQEFRSRPLQVRLASSQGAKRTATNVVSRVGRQSPSGPNGAKEQTPDVEMPSGERAARTLGLMNIPDTVSDARIKSLAEPYGKLIKVTLRPDHQGAIVEFADVNDAGRASLELAGQEIAPNRSIRVGTVPEMLKQRAERKGGAMAPQQKTATSLQPTGPIRRPQQPGARGRRGGLGMKRGSVPSTGSRRESVDGDLEGVQEGRGSGKTKSNADFRTMMQRQQPVDES